MVGNEKRWFAVARTATKPENMQGFHEDNYILFIGDIFYLMNSIKQAFPFIVVYRNLLIFEKNGVNFGVFWCQRRN
jgi:hypothetical protein